MTAAGTLTDNERDLADEAMASDLADEALAAGWVVDRRGNEVRVRHRDRPTVVEVVVHRGHSRVSGTPIGTVISGDPHVVLEAIRMAFADVEATVDG